MNYGIDFNCLDLLLDLSPIPGLSGFDCTGAAQCIDAGDPDGCLPRVLWLWGSPGAHLCARLLGSGQDLPAPSQTNGERLPDTVLFHKELVTLSHSPASLITESQVQCQRRYWARSGCLQLKLGDVSTFYNAFN